MQSGEFRKIIHMGLQSFAGRNARKLTKETGHGIGHPFLDRPQTNTHLFNGRILRSAVFARQGLDLKDIRVATSKLFANGGKVRSISFEHAFVPHLN